MSDGAYKYGEAPPRESTNRQYAKSKRSVAMTPHPMMDRTNEPEKAEPAGGNRRARELS